MSSLSHDYQIKFVAMFSRLPEYYTDVHFQGLSNFAMVTIIRQSCFLVIDKWDPLRSILRIILLTAWWNIITIKSYVNKRGIRTTVAQVTPTPESSRSHESSLVTLVQDLTPHTCRVLWTAQDLTLNADRESSLMHRSFATDVIAALFDDRQQKSFK